MNRLRTSAAILVLAAFVSPPEAANAKTSVTIKNCSNVQYVTIKSDNPWDSKMTLPYQWGTGSVYPVNHGDSATVECDSEKWFKSYSSCKIFADKEASLNLIQTLNAGTWHITADKKFASGAGNC